MSNGEVHSEYIPVEKNEIKRKRMTNGDYCKHFLFSSFSFLNPRNKRDRRHLRWKTKLVLNSFKDQSHRYLIEVDLLTNVLSPSIRC